jgi:hypothetical protein
MATFKFDINPTNTDLPLGVEFWIDNTCVFDSNAVTQSHTVTHEFDDEVDGDHEFRWVVKNKQPSHTQLDDSGNIVSDSTVIVSDFVLEDIDISQIVHDRAVYHHDFNGTADPINDLFFGAMGCNGTIVLKFTTPIYVWPLEVM